MMGMCGRGIEESILPAAAECFVEPDEVEGELGAGLDAVVFCEEEGAIGFEDIDEAGEACEVAVACEVAGAGGGGGAVGETGEAALFLTEVDECGFDVFEGGEDGFFVVGGGGSGVSGLGVGGGAELAGVEDGPAEAGAEGPEIALVIEE